MEQVLQGWYWEINVLLRVLSYFLRWVHENSAAKRSPSPSAARREVRFLRQFAVVALYRHRSPNQPRLLGH